MRWYERGVNALHSMTYETARKSLEQAVSVDPAFALAHASLARAYDELDYTDRAKDSMLRAVAAAQDSRLTDADDRKLRALQFMVSRDYARAAPLVKQTSKPRPALRIARRRRSNPAGLRSRWRTPTRRPPHSAARSRSTRRMPRRSFASGSCSAGRAARTNQALAAFGEAEHLYRTAGNLEGVTQTLLERANLLDRRNRENDALPVIDEALTMARAVGNRYQEVRLRFIRRPPSAISAIPSEPPRSSRDAIDAALAENMDNLAANGQIDLGNLYLRADKFDRAEPVFRRALDIARRAKVPRIEARAAGRARRAARAGPSPGRSETAHRGRADVLSSGRLPARIGAGGDRPRRTASAAR